MYVFIIMIMIILYDDFITQRTDDILSVIPEEVEELNTVNTFKSH